MSENHKECLRQLKKACDIINKINGSCGKSVCTNGTDLLCHELDIFESTKKNNRSISTSKNG